MSFIGFIEKSFITIPQETAKLIVLPHSPLKHIKNSHLSTKHGWGEMQNIEHIMVNTLTDMTMILI